MFLFTSHTLPLFPSLSSPPSLPLPLFRSLPLFPFLPLLELMRSLVLQDHFSARTETLLLDIEQEDLLTQNSFEREQLLMYKLAEASRVLLAKRLLLSAENSLEEFVSAAHMPAEHIL